MGNKITNKYLCQPLLLRDRSRSVTARCEALDRGEPGVPLCFIGTSCRAALGKTAFRHSRAPIMCMCANLTDRLPPTLEI